jgi:hypothetical protein
MKTYRDSSSKAPLIRNFSIKQLITLHSGHFTLWEGDPVPIEQGVGWVQKVVWMFFEKRKLLVPTRI